jgi:hypothetical protein
MSIHHCPHVNAPHEGLMREERSAFGRLLAHAETCCYAAVPGRMVETAIRPEAGYCRISSSSKPWSETWSHTSAVKLHS